MRQFLKKYSISTERRCHVIDDQSNIAMVEAGPAFHHAPDAPRSCTAAVKIYPIEPKSTGRWAGCPAPHGDGSGGRADVPPHRGLLPPTTRSFSENTK
ncbi:MAG: hypothetical protein ACLSGP_09555 [Faecalibacterium prausnitzii]